MKKSRQDPFPWDRFRDEMASVQMTRATKMRALSRMEGEQKMVRRTAYVLSLALVLLVLSIGGTLALSEHNRADKTDDVMLTLSSISARRSLIFTRVCSIVSRSRSVTQPSVNVSWSTVTQ